jgi:hypothetical protein
MKEFSSITNEEMDQALKFISPNSGDPIIRYDRRRMPVLYDLVKILEAHEKLASDGLKAWVESINILDYFGAISLISFRFTDLT